MVRVLDTREYWTIPELWPGESVLVIGGGHSLVGFDWGPLKNFNVIGCNDAYLLGDWVDVVLSGDPDWLRCHCKRQEYRDFKGLRVSLAPILSNDEDPDNPFPPAGDEGRTHHVRRISKGCSEGRNELGWHENTGAAAICLAVKMGASQVFLYGFDMKLHYDEKNKEWRNNWHQNNLDGPDPDVFVKHIGGHETVKAYMDKHHPKVGIYNCGPDSFLLTWPMLSPAYPATEEESFQRILQGIPLEEACLL